jgi:hypothetical protein
MGPKSEVQKRACAVDSSLLVGCLMAIVAVLFTVVA